MALFVWQCELCNAVTRKLLSSRPVLGVCCCGGKLQFKTNVSAVAKEVIDNGFMAKALERDADAEEQLKKRNDLADAPPEEII